MSILPKITNEWSDVRQKLPAQKESKGDARGMHQFWKSKLQNPSRFDAGWNVTVVTALPNTSQYNLWLFDIATEAMAYWVQW